MLVHEPHDLRGVHRGATANGDNGVGLELVTHHGGAALDGLDRRFRLDVVDDAEGDAVLAGAQLVDDLVDHAELLHDLVAHDDRAVEVVHVAQIPDRVRLEIGLRRHLEPLHVVVPPCDALDVDEVDGLDVAGHRVAAVGAAAQGQGRGDGVVDIADATKRARGVPDDTASVHAQTEFTGQILVVGVDGGGVAGAMLEHLFAHLESLLLIVGLEHGLHRAELFESKRLHLADFLAFGGKDGHVGGHFEASLMGDVLRGLARHDGVELRGATGIGGAAEHVLLKLGLLVGVHKVGLATLEFLDQRVVDVLVSDDRLLCGADHTVIEMLGEDEVVGGTLDIDIGIDVRRSIARADAECRLAGGVRSLDHTRAAGRENRGDAVVAHEGTGRLDGRMLNPLDTVLRRACGDGRVTHNLGGRDRALLRERMEAEDDRTPGLKRNQGLENRSRSRVGDRGDTRDHTDRLGDFINAEDIVGTDDADGLLPRQIVGNVLARENILGGLVFHKTTAGLVHSHLRQLQMLVQRCDGSLRDDVIDLLLIKLLKLLQGNLGLLDQLVDLSLSRDQLLFGAWLGSLCFLCFCQLVLLEPVLQKGSPPVGGSSPESVTFITM